jgi:hypothetical protein
MNYRLAVVPFLMAGGLFAQDAAAVLNRYVQVTGGSDLYQRYNSLHLFYTVTRADKSSVNVDYFHTRDGRMLTETDTGSATLDMGVSDGVVWKYSEGKGAQILNGAQAARVLAESKGFDEDDWHLRYPTVALLTNQTINGMACRHLKLTRTDGSTVERFYDIKSGLLVREVSNEFDDNGVEQPTTTDFQRYDTFFGVRRPVSLHVKAGLQDMTIEINTVTYSDKPEGGVAELPHDVVRAIVASRSKGGLPNPVDLIDKFVAATGGKDRYQMVKSEVVKAEVSFVSENLKFPVVSYSAGNKHYSSSEIPSMGKLETGDDGVTGWEKSVVMGPKLRPHSAGSEFTGPEPGLVMQWSAGAMDMETVSQDQVNGAPCYLVRLGQKGEDAATACFDVKTGLLVRTTQKDQDGVSQQVFSDYRSVNGFLVCYRIDTTVAGHTAAVEIKEMAVNQPLPAGIFDLPPDVRALKARRDAAQGKVPVSPDAPTLKRPVAPQ